MVEMSWYVVMTYFVQELELVERELRLVAGGVAKGAVTHGHS